MEKNSSPVLSSNFITDVLGLSGSSRRNSFASVSIRTRSSVEASPIPRADTKYVSIVMPQVAQASRKYGLSGASSPASQPRLYSLSSYHSVP